VKRKYQRGQTHGAANRNHHDRSRISRTAESNQLTELIEGEVIMSPSPTLSHQDAVFSIAKSVEKLAPGGKVRFAPTDVHFDDGNVASRIFWGIRGQHRLH